MAHAGSRRREATIAALCGLVAAAATITMLAMTAVPALARSAARFKDPRHNRHMSQATVAACQSAPDSATCVKLALADINAARAHEGVRPMRLPRRFRLLTGPQQLLVLSNLERIGRGLAPVLGLSRPLDRDARAGALRLMDPFPSHWYGNGYSANFAYGLSSTLEADFEWMYDDGYGSFNLDCKTPHASGCWGHRNDILFPFSSPIVMGAAVAVSHGYVVMSELFVGGDRATGPGQPDHPLSPNWNALRH